jgi:hypothetical protein
MTHASSIPIDEQITNHEAAQALERPNSRDTREALKPRDAQNQVSADRESMRTRTIDHYSKDALQSEDLRANGETQNAIEAKQEANEALALDLDVQLEQAIATECAHTLQVVITEAKEGAKHAGLGLKKLSAMKRAKRKLKQLTTQRTSPLPAPCASSIGRSIPDNGVDAGIPYDFCCPITLEIMRQPVVAEDGHTYERSAIADWFGRGKTTSPKTHAIIGHALVPNHTVRVLIDDLLQRQEACSTHIGEWLTATNPILGQYTAAFVEYGYDNVDVVQALGCINLAQAMQEMCVKKAHQKLIAKAFANCKVAAAAAL